MDEMDTILRTTAEVPDDSLARAGLHRYQGFPQPRYERGAMGEGAASCYEPAYKKNGVWVVPGLSRSCVKQILDLKDTDVIHPGLAIAWYNDMRAHGMSSQYGNFWGFLTNKKVSDIPNVPTNTVDTTGTIEDVVDTGIKTAQFVADPLNWAALFGLIIGVPLVLISLMKISGRDSTPVPGNQPVEGAVNYLPHKKAITIVR